MSASSQSYETGVGTFSQDTVPEIYTGFIKMKANAQYRVSEKSLKWRQRHSGIWKNKWHNKEKSAILGITKEDRLCIHFKN